MPGSLQTDFMPYPGLARTVGRAFLIAFYDPMLPPDGHPLAPGPYYKEVWVRSQTGRQLWRIVNPTGADYPNGFTISNLYTIGLPVLDWGRSATLVPPRAFAWAGFSADAHLAPPPATVPPGTPIGPTALYAEAYAILANALLVESSPGVVDMTHRLAHDTFPTSGSPAEDQPAPTFDPATQLYGTNPTNANLALAYSDTPYYVDASDTWITIGPRIGGSVDFEYPGDAPFHPVGTPAGKYELRAACINSFAPHSATFPPSALPQKNSVIAPGSSDVGLFRWTPTVGYDPTNPLSPPYQVDSYGYTITYSAPSLPPLAPDQFGSLWETITPGTLALWQASQGYDDHVRNNLQAPYYQHLGLTYQEDTAELVWLLGRNFQAQYRATYRWTTTFSVKRMDGSFVTQNGHIYQHEAPQWTARGLRVRVNGADTQVDYPAGVTHIVRQSEGPFPSKGGHLEATAPAIGFTVCGLNQILIPMGLGRPGGTYRIVRKTVDPDTFLATAWHLTDGAADVEITHPIAAFTMPDAIAIAEDTNGVFYLMFGPP